MFTVFKSEFDCGVYTVNFGYELVQLVLGAGPDDKNVINESFPEVYMFRTLVYEGGFEGSHEQVGICWCHFGAHGCAL